MLPETMACLLTSLLLRYPLLEQTTWPILLMGSTLPLFHATVKLLSEQKRNNNQRQRKESRGSKENVRNRQFSISEPQDESQWVRSRPRLGSCEANDPEANRRVSFAPEATLHTW